jgi:hypothetical protein
MDESFLIKPEELELRFQHQPGRRALSYRNVGGDFGQWRQRCLAKFAELLGLALPVSPGPGPVRQLRQTQHEGVDVKLLVMQVQPTLSLPAYLLVPPRQRRAGAAAMAIHGHSVYRGEGILGLKKGGYMGFAMELAKAGFLVLMPFHRGFGPLRDLAAGRPGYRLDYEQAMHFSYVMDAFLHGQTVVGQNISDLLAWEEWLARELSVKSILAAGLSYGGDLALAYPVFSRRVERIFASGSSGSFALHFVRCYNGPAHCVPGILQWMERSDVAGMNAPRKLALHYGELDRPCLNEPGGDNLAAAYNEAVPELYEEASAIYAAAGAAGKVKLLVSKGMGHAMDLPALLEFMQQAEQVSDTQG